MILFISSGVGHMGNMFRPCIGARFAVPTAYPFGIRAMTALLRKYNSSLFTFVIYLLLIGFALACSLGAF